MVRSVRARASAIYRIAILLVGLCLTPAQGSTSFVVKHVASRIVIDQVVRRAMEQDRIPGMAVGLVLHGRVTVLNYGVASITDRRPVDDSTLFELGSVSKTLTATLATWAVSRGRLRMADPVGDYLPELRNRPFGGVRVFDLATHTAGGLPLQVPDGIDDGDAFLRYLAEWRSTYPVGTKRTYSNPGIGTLGLIAARALGGDFDQLMQTQLFPQLGMPDTFIDIPPSSLTRYAQGYARDDRPIRMAPGVLAAEAYGVKSTARDMSHFLAVNMGDAPVGPGLRRAIDEAHLEYFTTGPMKQALIWEQYAAPVSLAALLEGNSEQMIYGTTAVTPISPAAKPLPSEWVNKTGSTNGFGAYVAYVPGSHVGVVLLANRNYPLPERVRLAYELLHLIDPENLGSRPNGR